MYVFLGYVYMDVYMCVCVSRAAVHVIPFLVSCGHLSMCPDMCIISCWVTGYTHYLDVRLLSIAARI